MGSEMCIRDSCNTGTNGLAETTTYGAGGSGGGAGVWYGTCAGGSSSGGAGGTSGRGGNGGAVGGVSDQYGGGGGGAGSAAVRGTSYYNPDKGIGGEGLQGPFALADASDPYYATGGGGRGHGSDQNNTPRLPVDAPGHGGSGGGSYQSDGYDGIVIVRTAA